MQKSLILFFILFLVLANIQSIILSYSKESSYIGTNISQTLTKGEKSYTDIGNLLIALIIFGILFFVVMTSKKIRNFAVENGLSRDPDKMGPPKSIRYILIDNTRDLVPVIQNISNNIKTIITIYGILLSFVIATQLQIVTSSITFIIWTGLILSIIIRGWYFEHSLSDIWIVDNLENTKLLIASAYLFSKRATYLFVVIISITPAFFIVSNDLSDNPVNPWSDEVTLLSISISIIVAAVIAYQFIFSFGKRSSGAIDLVVYSMIFLFLSVIGLNMSPLKEFPVTFFNMFEGSIPIILYFITIPILVVVGPYGVMYILYPPLGYLYKKLKNRHGGNKT